MTDSMAFFAACPKGIEQLLKNELQAFGAQNVKCSRAGCYFDGSLETAYRSCLWSRLASRILLILGQFPTSDRETLYHSAQLIPWQNHFIGKETTFAVNFTGVNQNIRNTLFAALVIKDAIVDYLVDKKGYRPSVQTKSPDLSIHGHLHQNQLQIAIDLSGGNLSRRGYRAEQGTAPLRENLACAILFRLNWQDQMHLADTCLLDPMCGSGTFLIEGAMMAIDAAPALFREHFGFEGWLNHQPKLWLTLLEEAKQRRQQGIKKLHATRFFGYDHDPNAIAYAAANAQRAGLDQLITFKQQSIKDMKSPGAFKHGLLVVNPPYGERLGNAPELLFLYRKLGEAILKHLPSWNAGLITANPPLCRRMGLKSHKQYSFFNGAIACKLLLFKISTHCQAEIAANSQKPESKQPQKDAIEISKLSPQAAMFANRLLKNKKHLAKWIKKNHINCYRVYDADLPDYAVAIDVYNDWVCIQEYQAPANIDLQKAESRLIEIIMIAPSVLHVKPNHIVLKTRSRQSGKQQYQARENHSKSHRLYVEESGCRFLVNLTDYIDTGLFLDHRPLRARIQQESKEKRFLNLFCYTATATIHAAKGGAKETVSVDLSKTYLNWAQENLKLNGFDRANHHLIREDCSSWLKREIHSKKSDQDLFDIIYLDPPTFSNSKKMKQIFEVQNDHLKLIEQTMELLKLDGTLYFSTNFRKFTLDNSLTERYQVFNITNQTFDKDFKMHTKKQSCPIHQCWMIKH